MNSRILAVGAIATLLCACAGPETVTATESPSEREYPTGSNLPRKKNATADSSSPSGMGVRAMSREEFERAQMSGRGLGAKDGIPP